MNDDYEQKLREFKQADVRFLILRILSQQLTYMANQELLLFALRELGNAICHDQLYVELSWLEQEANALTNKISGEMRVVKLNTTGLDIANGMMIVPGIRTPLPFEISG